MKWRAWRDFGTGALGDMGCHILDPAFWALELGAPPREATSTHYEPAGRRRPTRGRRSCGTSSRRAATGRR